jgi:hypothetical protein
MMGTEIAILEITLVTQCMTYPERCFRQRIQTSGTLWPEKVYKLLSLSLRSVKLIYVIYKYSVLTSQETHSVSITVSSLLMLLREISTVCCESIMKHINTLCRQNVYIFNM